MTQKIGYCPKGPSPITWIAVAMFGFALGRSYEQRRSGRTIDLSAPQQPPLLPISTTTP